LRKIELLLPAEVTRESRFHNELLTFLSGIPISSRRKRSLTFSPQFPHRSWPITAIGCSSGAEVQLNFFHYRRERIGLNDSPIQRILSTVEMKSKAESEAHSIDISRLNDILINKLVALDHIGLNVPSTLVSKPVRFTTIRRGKIGISSFHPRGWNGNTGFQIFGQGENHGGSSFTTTTPRYRSFNFASRRN
jgi:hypothetical protein